MTGVPLVAWPILQRPTCKYRVDCTIEMWSNDAWTQWSGHDGSEVGLAGGPGFTDQPMGSRPLAENEFYAAALKLREEARKAMSLFGDVLMMSLYT